MSEETEPDEESPEPAEEAAAEGSPAPEPDEAPAKKAAPRKKATAKKKAPAKKKATAKKKPSQKASDKPPARGGRSSKASYHEAVTDLVDRSIGAVIVAGVMSPRLAYDADVLSKHRATIIEELYERGLENPKLRQMIERGDGAAEWMRLISLATGIAIPICANHGLIPREVASLVVPDNMPPERPPKADTEEEQERAGAVPLFRRRKRDEPEPEPPTPEAEEAGPVTVRHPVETTMGHSLGWPEQ